jgi:hypothetical protein
MQRAKKPVSKRHFTAIDSGFVALFFSEKRARKLTTAPTLSKPIFGNL